MITYKIIEELNRRCNGIWIGGHNIRCLFFADDGLIVAETEGQTVEKIRVLEQVGEKYGLQIHKGKSRLLIFNRQEPIDNIEGIKVENEIRYLGIKIESRKDMFRGQREKMIRETRRMGKVAYSVMARACNRIVIGKTLEECGTYSNTVWG